VSPAWWAAFGPAETKLRCGDSEHRLRWADGMLQAVDHPDAEGELVLAALGGDTSPCLDLVAAWGKHSDDLAVLAIGPRSATDRLTFPVSVLDEIAAPSGNSQGRAVSIAGTISRHSRSAGMSVAIYSGQAGASARRVPPQLAARARAMRRARMRSARMRSGRVSYGRSFGWHGFAPGRRVPWGGGWEIDAGRGELIRLLALGPLFQFRLSAAVAHAWSADGEQADRTVRARPALTAALTGRLAFAAAQWLNVDPGEVEAKLYDGDGWGELALSGGTGRLQAQLPVGWLASVWGPGLAVVGQHLVVSVLDATWPTARVLALRSPGGDPEELGIRQDKGHWSVTSR
jgi:hypothetical protein